MVQVQFRRLSRNVYLLAMAALLIVGMAACGTGTTGGGAYSDGGLASTVPAENPNASPNAQTAIGPASKERGMGVWDGTTRANCSTSLPSRCNAQQEVSMTLLEGKNSKLTGYYKCSYGNMNCYNMNETGNIVDGSLTGNQISMRVMMRDGTSCRFSGRTTNGSVNGGYSCYTGGSILEQGTWLAHRAY